jgi:hypothetical protein
VKIVTTAAPGFSAVVISRPGDTGALIGSPAWSNALQAAKMNNQQIRLIRRM